MEWNKIKTIFIIAFLILDIYLGYEFYKLYNSNQYDYMSEMSFENQLKTEEIEYVELPKNIKKGVYLSATPKKFTQAELNKVKDTKLKGQSISVINGTTIKSNFEETIKINDDFDPAELSNFLKNRVYLGDQYDFWEMDKKNLTITYYQHLEDKLLYKNISGELTFYLNDKHEITSYKQTFLEKFEELSEEENILQPIKAIEILYENGKLPYGSKITKVELGYYTLVHLSSSQVLTPVWRFVVNDKEDLFVNAIEGQIIQLNNEDKKIVE